MLFPQDANSWLQKTTTKKGKTNNKHSLRSTQYFENYPDIQTFMAKIVITNVSYFYIIVPLVTFAWGSAFLQPSPVHGTIYTSENLD